MGRSQKSSYTLFAGKVVAERSSGPSPFVRILRPFRDVFSIFRGEGYLISYTLCVCTLHMYVHVTVVSGVVKYVQL